MTSTVPGSRVIHAPTGTTLSCKGWQQEAALRMLMNNLDPAVAEQPEQLIVYGTPEEARRRLQRWHAAGAESVGLLLRPALPPEELALTLDAFVPMLESGIASA